MNKGLEINVEMGLCTKEMAKENPIKDFEILVEEHKGKWSEQMYEYFKECLNEIKKKERALEIISKKFKISVYHSRHTKTGYEMCIEDNDGKVVYEDITEEEYEVLL